MICFLGGGIGMFYLKYLRFGTIIIFLLCGFLSGNVQADCQKPSGITPFSPSEYYQTAMGKTGSELKSALNVIIKGHTRHSYKCVWKILEESDEDPNNRNNVILIYTGRSLAKSKKVRSSGGNNNWNREHVWAKSHGFKRKDQSAHTDAHHLRPSDKTVNSDRGNMDFGSGGRKHHECKHCRFTSNTWEPPDTVKGDVARMMFYMATRYEGSDQSKTPDLEIVEGITHIGSTRFGRLCDLYNWNKEDPVDDFEKRRNEVIYSWQGNRNPYIDHPEFAKTIWGSQCQDDDQDPPPITPPTSEEKLQAIINILEEKNILTEDDILDEVQKMRE